MHNIEYCVQNVDWLPISQNFYWLKGLLELERKKMHESDN